MNLTPPRTTQSVEVEQLRFTHGTISECFIHGPGRGFLITDMVSVVDAGKISPFSDCFVLDVVWWHGFYRSLNNRHLILAELSRMRECRVRVWPLTTGLPLRCGRGDVCVVRKFLDSRSTRNGGVSACMRPSAPRP